MWRRGITYSIEIAIQVTNVKYLTSEWSLYVICE